MIYLKWILRLSMLFIVCRPLDLAPLCTPSFPSNPFPSLTLKHPQSSFFSFILETRNAFNSSLFVSKPDPHPPSQKNKGLRAAVVPERARCFPLSVCSLMTKTSCCSCLQRPLLCGSIVDHAALVYSWTTRGKTFWTATSLSPHTLRIQIVCVNQRKRVRVCVSIYTSLWDLHSHWSADSDWSIGGMVDIVAPSAQALIVFWRKTIYGTECHFFKLFWVSGPFICLTRFVHP